MGKFFNGDRPRKQNKCYTSKPVMFRGKYWLARELVELPEAEVVEATIRLNLTKLEKDIKDGKKILSDDNVLNCIKKVGHKKGPKYKGSPVDWNMLNSLWK